MEQILILGGNGFIGYELMCVLLENHKTDSETHRWNITLINRGRSWDWNKKDFIKGKVKCINWDRNKALAECEELQTLLKTVQIFRVVVDFSGYSKKQVKNALKALNGKTRLYIYISTDSVYEVCCKDHTGLTLETDDRRPESPHLLKKLKREDSYGHKKLRCEECICKCLENSDTKYVILRLADVIGPRDSTDRFWQYHLWIKLTTVLKIPVFVPKSVQDTQLSLVYVKDVAMLILQVVYMTDEEVTKISHAAYNLAFKETVKLQDLLNLMHQAILKHNSGSSQSLENIERKPKMFTVKYDSSSKVPHIYPSVEKGPVGIQKAISKLHWDPTTIGNAVFDICSFYEEVCHLKGFTEEKKYINSELLEDVRDLYTSDVYDSIKAFLRKILG